MNTFVNRVHEKWMAQAPHLWWGDRVDARFLVADAVRSLQRCRVLDIGCNAGVMLSEVPPTNERIGVDRSLEAIELARRHNPSVPFAVADMMTLPFQDASIDAVLFCGMLEVPPRCFQVGAVQEVARVLRPGGRLYLTTMNRRYRRYRRHPSTVTYEELEALLRPWFRYEIRGFNPFPPFPFFLPNRWLAEVPGIWPFLQTLMRHRVAERSSCAFLVTAVKYP